MANDCILFSMIDPLDAQILHALQLSPRISFRGIAAVLEVSEQTVARRYHKLRRDGVVRVVGLVNPGIYGDAQWVARIHAKPERIPHLANALIRRPDVAHANISSGWTELVCTIRGPLGAEREDVLLQQLSRTASVLDITVDLVLHTFGQPATSQWTGYGQKLSAEAVQEVLAQRSSSRGRFVPPTVDDGPMLNALAEDGRASHAELAQRARWSVAKVGRRIAILEESGALYYDVDLLPDRVGHHVSATLWLTVSPQHLNMVGEQVAAHDQIAFAAAVSGRHNLMAVAICRDAEDLYRYLTDQLGAIKQVSGYDVSIRSRRLKQSGSVIVEGRLSAPTAP